jgi:hypothetical protein
MIKPHKAICKQCGHEKTIANSKGVCIDCVFANNHGGKNKQQVYKEKSKPKKHKKTGELDLFIEIWNERPHYCVKCSKWLGNSLKPVFFSHIKSKGAYPELRLTKTNIELLCMDCHYIYEFGDRNKLQK